MAQKSKPSPSSQKKASPVSPPPADTKGISVSKEKDLSEWFTQVITKAELIDYPPIQGFMIIRPHAYALWENIQAYFNKVLLEKGVQNAYFPLLIPDAFFKKEAEHAKGFAPELAYIKGTEQGQLLALRPTSETIIYDSFAKWIRSWRDLPLKVNQWCNVIRWEVKQTKPFLRTREFLWQEGHCAFGTQEEARANMREMLVAYKKLVEEQLAIPVFPGRKSKAETFPGADMSMTIEALMPDGKALQMGTSHSLKRDFAHSFGVSFLGQDGQHHAIWPTSWGVSTRLLGGVIMVHGDDKGLVIPPRLARHQVVIVPIVFEENKAQLLAKAASLRSALAPLSILIDDRDGYSPGWKFNEWELKGVPVRIELGPKDLAKKQVIVVRRDTGVKEAVPEEQLPTYLPALLERMHQDMFLKAKRFVDGQVMTASSLKELQKGIKERKLVKVYMVDDPKVEQKVKDATDGATSRFVEEVAKEGTCIQTGEKTYTIAYFAKSY
jgi:prolyl-tRNA synthetase